MADDASTRKLASIVAIDVAGYSRRTEADEDASVRAVAVLREQIGRSARAHGGRVFNTAGDGFMLEFPTASGALGAAEEIARSGDPPVRVGVHVGEVSVTESGDLLGHGVNVAARIQQMASPGAVLVSGEAICWMPATWQIAGLRHRPHRRGVGDRVRRPPRARRERGRKDPADGLAGGRAGLR